MKFSTQLIVITLIPIIIFATLFPIAFSIAIREPLILGSHDKATSLTGFVAKDLQNSVYFEDLDEIEEKIQSLRKNYPLNSIYVMRPDGRILSDGTNNNSLYDTIPQNHLIQKSITSNSMFVDLTDKTIFVTSPIVLSEKIGIIYLEYSISDLDMIFESTFFILFTIVGIGTGVSILIAYFSSRSLSKPVDILQKAADDISNERFNPILDVENPEELKLLAEHMKQMIVKLEKSRNEIARSARLSSLGEISGRISHDLRNPLSVISNAIVLIKEKDQLELSKNSQKHLDLIQDQVERMNAIIRDVLDSARLKPIQMEKIQLSKILQKTISTVTIPSGISINLPKNDIEIFCDESQIQVVFFNLISNAIDILRNNGEITISADTNNDKNIIKISDNGPGIAQNDLSRIFEPLYTTKLHGTGLGLVSCKNIIEQHGGTIHAENDSGATFTIVLPNTIGT